MDHQLSTDAVLMNAAARAPQRIDCGSNCEGYIGPACNSQWRPPNPAGEWHDELSAETRPPPSIYGKVPPRGQQPT